MGPCAVTCRVIILEKEIRCRLLFKKKIENFQQDYSRRRRISWLSKKVGEEVK